MLKLGWLTGDVYTYSAGGPITVTIKALEDYRRKIIGKYYVAKIPDPADPNHFFTIELRQNSAWDQGVQRLQSYSGAPAVDAAVLVHEVTKRSFFTEPADCTKVHGYRGYLRKTGLAGNSVHDSANGFLYRRGTFFDSNSGAQITVDRIGCGTADVTIGSSIPPPSQPPVAPPSSFTANPVCGGGVDLSASGRAPDPAECTGLVPYVVFQRQVNGMWVDLSYSGTGPGMQDAPPGDTAVYRACNRNADGNNCTASVDVTVSYGFCGGGGGKRTCGGPGQPVCPTTH